MVDKVKDPCGRRISAASNGDRFAIHISDGDGLHRPAVTGELPDFGAGSEIPNSHSRVIAGRNANRSAIHSGSRYRIYASSVTVQLANLGAGYEIPDPHRVVGLPGGNHVRTAVDFNS
jgi:hypothetical protein